MGLGAWSRWGWGDCEGYALEFGNLFRADIVRRNNRILGEPDRFVASYPKAGSEAFDTADEAAAWVEQNLASDITCLLDYWSRFTPGKFKRRSGGRRR